MSSQKMMSKWLLLVAMVALAGCTIVEPGHVGIVVNQAGSNKGVDKLPVQTGRVWYNPMTQDVFEYPTFVQTAVWTKDRTEEGKNEEITFSTKDSMAVAADVSLGYSLIGDKVPAFYVKFRSDDLERFTHGFLRNLARDHFNEVAGKFTVEQIMSGNEQFVREVRGRLQADLEPLGIQLEQFGFMGAPRPPGSVIEAINAKVGATQLALQKQNELVSAQADAAKAVAAAEGQAASTLKLAEAQAEANRKLAASLTRELVDYEAIKKWNGALPQVSGQATPFINLQK